MTEPIEAAELRALARLAWNGWPDNEASRKILAESEAKDDISRAAWDKVVAAILTATRPSPVLDASHNNGERLPNSDAAELGDGRPAASGDLRERIARIVGGDIFGMPDNSAGPATLAARKNALAKADAILASLPGRDEEVLLDRVVKFDDCETAEPTLRQMIRQYYIQGLQPDTEHALELSGRFVRSLKTESGS